MFICEYKYNGVSHLPVIYDPVQLLPGLVNSVSVCAVNDKYETLRPGIVVSPEGTDFVLAAYILKHNGLIFNTRVLYVGNVLLFNRKHYQLS